MVLPATQAVVRPLCNFFPAVHTGRRRALGSPRGRERWNLVTSRRTPTSLLLKPTRRSKLSEEVAQQILEGIKGLEPGTRVPPERELTQLLGVSRTTVREALRGLAAIGAVDVRHGEGVFVAQAAPPPHLDELAAALAKGFRSDVFEARMVVLTAIARLAAERRTEEDLANLHAVLATREAAIASGRSLGGTGLDFDDCLADAAHSEVLAAVTRLITRLMHERASRVYSTHPEFAVLDAAMHRGIFEAVESGNPEEAGPRMEEHLVRTDEFATRLDVA